MLDKVKGFIKKTDWETCRVEGADLFAKRCWVLIASTLIADAVFVAGGALKDALERKEGKKK